jgi:hypothetical protein
MTNTAAIATKLNVLESAIVRVEEWANVMFVVVKGLGARFVSKKVVENKMNPKKIEYQAENRAGQLCSARAIAVEGGYKMQIHDGQNWKTKGSVVPADTFFTRLHLIPNAKITY